MSPSDQNPKVATEEEYINGPRVWPEGTPEDTPRCEYSPHYIIAAAGRKCGYPASYLDDHGRPRCIFHKPGSRKGEPELKIALEEAVARGADLWEANLQEADLSDAKLQKADLTGAELQGADLSRANLQGATLEDAVLGSGTILCWTNLTDTKLEGIRISPVVILEEVIRGEEEKPIIREEREGYPSIAEPIYRMIKRAYQQQGQYSLAGEFFIREMECRRKSLRWYKQAPYLITRILCGYFEKPLRSSTGSR